MSIDLHVVNIFGFFFFLRAFFFPTGLHCANVNFPATPYRTGSSVEHSDQGCAK